MIQEVTNNIITALYSDPVYLLIGIILSALILYSLLKKLIKLVIYLLAILFLYIGYLYLTGQDLPKNVDEIINQGTEMIQQGGNLLEKSLDLKSINEVNE